jgi:hypothetical protein
MPSASLQLLPSGLLGFFQLKNGGQYPQSLNPQLQPTLELLDWYTEIGTLGTSEVVGDTIAAVAVGANNSALVVPNLQAWFVHELCCSSTPGAGAACDIAGAISFGSAGFAVGPYVAIAANQNGRTLMTDRKRFVLPGGTLIVLCRSQTLAPAVTINARITRLPF